MVRLIRFSYWMENFSRTFHLLLVFSPAQDMTKCFLADLFLTCIQLHKYFLYLRDEAREIFISMFII